MIHDPVDQIELLFDKQLMIVVDQADQMHDAAFGLDTISACDILEDDLRDEGRLPGRQRGDIEDFGEKNEWEKEKR